MNIVLRRPMLVQFKGTVAISPGSEETMHLKRPALGLSVTVLFEGGGVRGSSGGEALGKLGRGCWGGGGGGSRSQSTLRIASLDHALEKCYHLFRVLSLLKVSREMVAGPEDFVFICELLFEILNLFSQ